MEKELFIGQKKVINMMVSGLKGKGTVMELSIFKMEMFMKESIRKIRNMEKELKL